jgi:hypothetical protein
MIFRKNIYIIYRMVRYLKTRTKQQKSRTKRRTKQRKSRSLKKRRTKQRKSRSFKKKQKRKTSKKKNYRRMVGGGLFSKSTSEEETLRNIINDDVVVNFLVENRNYYPYIISKVKSGNATQIDINTIKARVKAVLAVSKEMDAKSERVEEEKNLHEQGKMAPWEEFPDLARIRNKEREALKILGNLEVGFIPMSDLDYD